MIYFFYTSALVKGYRREIGTEKVLEIFHSNNDIVIANIAIVEFISAIKRKLNRKEATEEQFDVAIGDFSQDVLDRFMIRRLEDDHVGIAAEIAKETNLRAGDSIQLAIVLEGKQTYTFVCSDRGLLEAARLYGINVMNPED